MIVCFVVPVQGHRPLPILYRGCSPLLSAATSLPQTFDVQWPNRQNGVSVRCINLFRDARTASIELSRVRVSGDFVGEPAVADEIRYEVEVAGNASEEELRGLIGSVDEIAVILNSLRQGTRVRLVGAKVDQAP